MVEKRRVVFDYRRGVATVHMETGRLMAILWPLAADDAGESSLRELIQFIGDEARAYAIEEFCQ